MAGVLPKQAVTMTKDKMDRFMKAMGLDMAPLEIPGGKSYFYLQNP